MLVYQNVQLKRKNQKKLEDKEISDYISKIYYIFYLYNKLGEKKSKRKQIHRLR
jgi:hypothetical protein